MLVFFKIENPLLYETKLTKLILNKQEEMKEKKLNKSQRERTKLKTNIVADLIETLIS